ncbi:MAG: OmpA family protein [Firmicutes bacterium]|nr:OmpA family protein [Bacillota bacterium]
MRSGRQNTRKGAPAWMNTYGDMVTLLLTFFVLLYSFSSIDAEKWQALVISLSGGQRGVMQHTAHTSDSELQQDIDFAQLQAELAEFQRLYDSIVRYVEENNLAAQILLSHTDNEIQMRFVDNVLFDSGKANLKPAASNILSQIATALTSHRDSIKMVRIEGHTDNVVINTSEFPSNWELSTTRAVEVLKYLVESNRVEPSMVSAVGYGEYHPIADNDLPSGRASNRRVDFVIARSLNE